MVRVGDPSTVANGALASSVTRSWSVGCAQGRPNMARRDGCQRRFNSSARRAVVLTESPRVANMDALPLPPQGRPLGRNMWRVPRWDPSSVSCAAVRYPVPIGSNEYQRTQDQEL